MKKTVPVLLTLLILAGPSCKRPAASTPAGAESPRQTFTVQGILRAIDFAGKAVTVAHEDIPQYMPAMTMPFNVRTMSEVEPLKAGEAIEFQLIVTGTTSWIEGVKKVDRGEIQLPDAKAADAPTAKSERLKDGDPLPDFELVDSNQQRITRATFAGHPLVLTFIFTRCPIPNFCPLMSNHLVAIRDAVAQDNKLAEELRLLTISFDPEYDTPERLAEYADRYTDNPERWRFATGSKEQIEQLTSAFSVLVKSGDGTIDHGLATALIDRAGVIRKIWRGNGWQPAEVVEELRKL